MNVPLPIAEDAVELRVNVDYHWPEELEGATDTSSWTVRKAHEAARDLFAQYRAGRSLNAKDTRLTPQGALEADRQWVNENLSKLDKPAESLRRTSEGLDRQIENMMGDLAQRPDDPMEFQELKEIRDWLRTLPEKDRTDKIDFLVRHGDTKALRAVLTAPAYLTGVDENMLVFIREDVARKADPERFAKIEALRKAHQAAARAVDGVRRYLVQDTQPEALPTRATLGRPGLRAVGGR
jgi:hypothetical protein